MTRVALLWHMHQPYYEDLVTREHIMPWVRLHALKDYYGMAALLAEFPDVRVTFNLVPSLLVQLEAFAENRARDRYLETGMKPAETLTADDVVFMLQNFFHAQRQRMIDVYPRYAELLAERGTAAAIESAARRFTIDDLRDLQVWQKLAWIDPEYLTHDARIVRLIEKGRQFTEEDKAMLRQVELEILNLVIPLYRARAEAGQIEISTSPFYHPILPLLCDTEVYRRTHPDSKLPRHRFRHPEDAADQLERASRCHERLFGRRPVGLWPSEGSVSDEMVPLAARAGFEWMATDELILSRTLNIGFQRDAAGRVDRPIELYRPYQVHAGGAAVTCGFRDHVLSDLIGFTYASWSAEQAAEDFVGRLAAAGAAARSAGQADPTIFVILDGENAWEHFEGGGRPFLRALYKRLSHHPELTTVTMAEACRGASTALNGIFPGSWIDANFYIWIGHQDDQRGWTQLADARAVLESTRGEDPAAVARAHEEILIAEGSDWFWWYGDDHSSDHDAEFDDLFRRHLRNVYRLLGRPVPDELFVTNISTGPLGSTQTDPRDRISPTLDGEETSYFEWLGAGRVEIRETAGAMHQAERRQGVLTDIRFGFDRQRLYLRFDGSRRMADWLAEGYRFTATFLDPEGLRVLVAANSTSTVQAVLERRQADGVNWTRDTFRGTAAGGHILELAVPLSDLSPATLPRLALVATAIDPSGVEIERHPMGRPIELVVPDSAFDARNWSV